MARQMTKWQRVQAALRGDDVDRVPIALWKHYHLLDRSARQLADISVAFHRQFDTDLIKLTPSNLYPILDWGATVRFGADEDTMPITPVPIISAPEQWAKLPRLDPRKGALGRELETIRLVADMVGDSAPFVMTIFNPIATAYKLRGDSVTGPEMWRDMRENPRELHAGLAIVRDTLIEYAAACLEAGASGIYFSSRWACSDVMTPAQYREFGVPYDVDFLESLRGKSKVTIIHLCRHSVLMDEVADYPVDAIHWDDKAQNCPSLAEGRKKTKAAIAGGLSLDTLLKGTPDQVMAEAHEAIAQAGRNHFILAPGCVIHGPTPDANLAAARRAVEVES
ncbi:hypothetical protein LLG95_12100 [bacterium]|nr:hypothetical protein [bacterium]